MECFNNSDIEYMFTGAMAVSYYGHPRTTMDIDIVLSTQMAEVDRLLKVLEKAKLQADPKRITAAIDSGYNILTVKDTLSPFTVDIIVTQEHLQKRIGTIVGLPTYYQTPEGLILAKLRMIKATTKPEIVAKDREDVKAILRHTPVDLGLIEARAVQENTLGVLESIGFPVETMRRNTPSVGP